MDLDSSQLGVFQALVERSFKRHPDEDVPMLAGKDKFGKCPTAFYGSFLLLPCSYVLAGAFAGHHLKILSLYLQGPGYCFQYIALRTNKNAGF
jgi:hypothetical protein